MPHITEQKLVEQLQSLKAIKPREPWASLLLSQILTDSPEAQVAPKNKANFAGMVDSSIYSLFQRKWAYGFAAVLFVVAGFVGFSQYLMPGAAPYQANVLGSVTLTQNINNLSAKVNDLAVVSKEGKTDTSVAGEVKINVSQLANALTKTPANPAEIKEIASTLKVLADVPGTDLNKSLDVQNLYQAVVQSQISDLSKATLTADQQVILQDAQDLYLQGNYADALEKLLLINN